MKYKEDINKETKPQLSVRIQREIDRRIREYARRHKRTVTSVVEDVFAYGLEKALEK
jgi:hypothetical protein